MLKKLCFDKKYYPLIILAVFIIVLCLIYQNHRPCENIENQPIFLERSVIFTKEPPLDAGVSNSSLSHTQENQIPSEQHKVIYRLPDTALQYNIGNRTVWNYENHTHFTYFPNEEPQTDPVGPIIVFSSIYYRHSKIFPENTALISFRGRFNLSTSQKWLCESTNADGEKLTSEAVLSSVHVANIMCYFHPFTAKCPTIPHPTTLSLRLPDSPTSVPLPLETAVQEKHPVVSCLSSIFFAERWQQVVVTAEIMLRLGVDRQVYYFISGAESVFELLNEYVKDGVADLHLWGLPETNDFNVKEELYGRDQMGSWNHCFNLYRESADFVIVHDFDDVLVSTGGLDYHSLFTRLYTDNPGGGYLMFKSFASLIESTSDAVHIDVRSALESVSISESVTKGKSVYKTSMIENVWIHQPHFVPDNLTEILASDEDGMLVHMRYWNIDGVVHNWRLGMGKPHPLYSDLRRLMNVTTFESIIFGLETRINRYRARNARLFDLRSSSNYFRQIDSCVQRYSGRTASIHGCRTPFNCQIRPVLGFRCVESRRKFEGHYLKDNFVVYTPSEAAHSVTLNNGCRT